MANSQDKEIQQYRDLVKVPDQFEDGFGGKTIVGALFLGFLMLPGSIYLSLFMGSGLGPAARWVTVILFAEIAKRSMKNLRKQEVFILFYMTGIALGGQLHGGILTQMLWNQFLVRSPAVTGFGIDVPSFIAPAREIIEQGQRTFFTRDWLVPIAFLGGVLLLQRIDHFGLGYALYRWTAHVERLPFPMAPVGALGITALADVQDKTQQWRWRWFSIGGACGLAFGTIYIGVPAITGALFGLPVRIIPIPFLDFTADLSTNTFMPATPMNLVFDLTLVVLGMVLPFWAVVGGFIGLVFTFFLNPFLHSKGMLTTWRPGMGLVDTVFSNHIDFYLSFSIGLTLAIFLMTLGQILKPIFKAWWRTGDKEQAAEAGSSLMERIRGISKRSRNRGDISVFLAISIYLFSTCSYIGICTMLIEGFPWLFFLVFGLMYQPMMSYVNAKLEGLIGQTVQIPLVREAAFILSGYRGSEIWFAPIPISDYGRATQEFKVLELTGTRLTSVIKTELLIMPVVLVASLLFSNFIWQLAPIPSSAYPYAQELWELQARQFALTATATAAGSSEFIEAVKPDVIGWGLGVGLGSFALLSFLNLPTFLIYGVVRGMGQTTPGNVVPELIGAMVGRFFLQKKLGHQAYKQYVAVMFAGFGAGMGLIGMICVAFALIVKSTSTLGY
jgi:hypothetical protein